MLVALKTLTLSLKIMIDAQEIAVAIGLSSSLELLWHALLIFFFVAWLVWFSRLERRRNNWALLHYGSCRSMDKLVIQRLRALASSFGKERGN